MGRSRKSKMAQLTGHPAFPLVVALWFAVLIGLGSLVVPSALVERAVVASGLPQLISAAAPPLGMTARGGIAVLAALAGAVIGLLLGRQAYRATHADKRTVSPINAHEELGENGLDGAQEPALEPGDLAEELEDKLADDADEQSWDTAWIDHEEQLEPEAEIAPEPEPQIEAKPAPEAEEDIAQLSEAPPIAADEQEAEPGYEPTPAPPALDDLSLMQLAQRLQGAIEERRKRHTEQPASAAPTPVPSPASMPPTSAAPASEEPNAPTETQSPAPTDHEPRDEPKAETVPHLAAKPFVVTDELIAEDGAASGGDEAALGESYSSLLAMTASVRALPDTLVPPDVLETQGDAIDAKPQDHSEPAGTLATLDRAGQKHLQEKAPDRNVDPQEQALRDALMNLNQFSKHK